MGIATLNPSYGLRRIQVHSPNEYCAKWRMKKASSTLLAFGALAKSEPPQGQNRSADDTKAADTHKTKAKKQRANHGVLPPIRSKVEQSLFKEAQPLIHR
jgi:hypothetical protein